MPEPIPPFDELPELMLSLRSFGSGRQPNETATLADEQARFFAPLLDARRAAANAVTRAQVIAAFDSRRLTALIDATIRVFASERFGASAPARRAFEAELFEIVEPVRDALHSLAVVADRPVGTEESCDQDPQWNLWIAHLRVVYRVADNSWPALATALVASPRTAESRARRAEERR